MMGEEVRPGERGLGRSETVFIRTPAHVRFAPRVGQLSVLVGARVFFTQNSHTSVQIFPPPMHP